MSNVSCPFEQRVRKAAEGGGLSEDLREHLGHCADCAVTARVASWMSRFATIEERSHPLPDPAILRFKAKLWQEEVAARRAAMPIAFLERIAYLTIAASWATLLGWKWTAFQVWISDLELSRILVSPPPVSFSLLTIVLVLGAATAMLLAAHSMLAE